MATKSAPLNRMALLMPFLQHFEANGGDVIHLAASIGIDPAVLDDPLALVPSSTMNVAANSISDELNDPYVGARIGQSWGATSDGPFKKARKDSRLLGEALNRILLDYSHESAAGRYELSTTGHFAVFKGGRTYKPRVSTAQADATFFSFMLELIRNWVGDAWDHDDVVVLVPDGRAIPDWVIPSSSVLQGAEGNLSIRFPASWLNFENHNDPFLSEGLSHPTSFDRIEISPVQALRKHIGGNLADKDLDLNRAAKACGYTRRALQRLLAAEGTNFAACVADEKHKGAIRALSDPNETITDIAHSLGYSSASNFTRAFRQRAGITPSEYRNKVQAQTR